MPSFRTETATVAPFAFAVPYRHPLRFRRTLPPPPSLPPHLTVAAFVSAVPYRRPLRSRRTLPPPLSLPPYLTATPCASAVPDRTTCALAVPYCHPLRFRHTLPPPLSACSGMNKVIKQLSILTRSVLIMAQVEKAIFLSSSRWTSLTADATSFHEYLSNYQSLPRVCSQGERFFGE